MSKLKAKQRMLIIAGIAFVAVLLLVGIIILVNSLRADKVDPYKQDTSSAETTSSDESENQTDSSKDDQEIKSDTTKPETDTPASTIDPATVSAIDIQPMSLTVSYVKGIGGFEYAVKRTTSGTQYVEFSSPELVGTKCTDDTGAFASIITNPSSDESATLAQTTVVDGTKYGLSLNAANCTKDAELLKKYQASFNDAYSLLKKL